MENLKRNNILANDQGTVIVSALLILMLLTLVVLMATNTTTSEKAMVRSEAVFQKDFYYAESASLEGVQKVVNECVNNSTPDLTECLAPLVTAASDHVDLLRSADSTNDEVDAWNLDTTGDNQFTDADLANLDKSEGDASGDTYRAVVQRPIPSGSSLGVETSRLYDYFSYGYSETDGGRALIKIGLKARF